MLFFEVFERNAIVKLYKNINLIKHYHLSLFIQYKLDVRAKQFNGVRLCDSNPAIILKQLNAPISSNCTNDNKVFNTPSATNDHSLPHNSLAIVTTSGVPWTNKQTHTFTKEFQWMAPSTTSQGEQESVLVTWELFDNRERPLLYSSWAAVRNDHQRSVQCQFKPRRQLVDWYGGIKVECC